MYKKFSLDVFLTLLTSIFLPNLYLSPYMTITIKMDTHTNIDPNSIKRRFIALNHDRVSRINQSLRWRQRDFLKLLPLLLHINDESLPGYVSDDTPVGVSNYKPSKTCLDAAKRINKKFKHSKRALSRYNIYSLFLTGSSGTIAHTEQSDFDIWLCHRADMDPAEIDLLKEKTNAISKWCASLELEVHFFLMNEHRFKENDHGSMNADHSGSAQHHLLLEEFYRTGVYLAGRYPLWWLVPPEHEHDYDNYAKDLIENNKISEFEVIDFGGLDNIPAEEFFGASLWQIYKGIDSPYKSVLKILLMESYANEFPDIELLCIRLKKFIYSGVTDLVEIDPYLMMCHKVEEYLTSRNEPQRLELARRCFYFKVDIQLSKRHDEQELRAIMLRNLVNQWDWDDAHILMLDSRQTWKIHRVLDERKKLVDELTRSYKLLSGFANQYTKDTNIDQRDMTILGRKLYAAFERKSGKIDIVNPGISPNLVEEQLSFVELDKNWLLYRGKVSQKDRKRNNPLRHSRSIIELICWCHFNHLIGHNTSLFLQAADNNINIREIKQILSSLDQQFPRGGLPKSSTNLFSKASHSIRTMLFINVGIDPMSVHNRDDRQLISNRTNALSYSGLLDNLVLSIDQVAINTWQEVYSRSYSGINEVMECLCKNIQMSTVSNNVILPIITAYSFSSSLNQTVAQRVESIFNSVIRYFHRSDNSSYSRYVIGVEDNYYLLQRHNSNSAKPVVSYHRVGDYPALQDRLGQVEPVYSSVVFDELTLQSHYLPDIYATHQQGQIDVYVNVERNIANITILDEQGALFYTTQEFYNLDTIMAHYDSFFYAISQRINSFCLDEEQFQPLKVRYFTLRHLLREWDIKPYYIDHMQTPMNPVDVTVIIETLNNQPQYKVFCNDREFSSFQFGDDVFKELADHILSLRLGKSDYPLYISDIDISFQTDTDEPEKIPQTINYLQYKIKFEQQLNSALTQLFDLQAHRLS